MQITSPPRWLMIVSTPIAVLPVPRSPMISSRCPRPIGIIESIALSPVWSGSFTGWRWMTPGALNSSGRRLGRRDRAQAVERVAERVDDAAEQPLADRHAHHRAGAAHRLALLDVLPLAEERDADVVLLEVEGDADDAVLELEPLEGDAVLEAVDAGDAVADLEHGADLREVGLDVVLLDPLLEDRGDLFGAELHGTLSSAFGAQFRVTSSRRRRSRRPRTLASTRSEPAWRIIPPIRSGSTERVASTVRPEACSILRDDRARLVVGELVRGRQLDREAALLAVDDRLELLGDPARARRRGPSPRRGARSSGRGVGARGDLLEHARPWRRGSSCGLREERRELGDRRRAPPRARRARRATTSTRSCVPRRLEERARVHALRDRHRSASSSGPPGRRSRGRRPPPR